VRPEAEPWWRQAEADLAAGRDVLTAGHAFAASWFAHQSVEKGLKALFIETRGVLAPRTHDLVWLGRAVTAPAVMVAHLVHLNPVFLLARYPDPVTAIAPVDVITTAVAEQDAEAAEEVMAWIRQQLGV
jgi:HEPN domain-containing protein